MIKNKNMRQFLELCLNINDEQDRTALLSNILDTALDLAHCDAGTLYLLENNHLRFCQMHTRSLNIRQGGPDAIDLPPVPMEENYVCAWAALHNQIINVDDVSADERFDFSGPAHYDKLTGYHTVSMLVVPMTNEKGRLIGVMQLINALSDKGKIIPFVQEDELIISAIASQAAISLTNILYADRISLLLDSLVKSLSTAVDERSAYTGSHTRHMVQLAENFLDWLENTENDLRFNNDKRKAFLMGVWLHDIGKLTIPLEIMDKATRLGNLLPELEERLRVIGLLDRIAMLEGKITEDELSSRNQNREEILAFILQMNGGKPLSEEDIARIEDISRLTYKDEKNKKHPWITEEERNCLLIGRGTLTAEERSIMESHVVMTRRILEHVKFPSIYEQVPVWASEHHEFLNGKGYPEHIADDSIPLEARLLTILDVFEALTAKDRPYKKPMPLRKALLVLDDMAARGQIDPDILALFKKSRAWRGVL
ncbi:MAG: GAF domain-containing protein [Stomatobaculum sp.]|nr:GAF domain-containing protein [Stomatobaculum sp.]